MVVRRPDGTKLELGLADPGLGDSEDSVKLERAPSDDWQEFARYFTYPETKRLLRGGRLSPQPCEVCGNKKAGAHHDENTKPAEVRWLSKKHHFAHHRLLGWGIAGRKRDEDRRFHLTIRIDRELRAALVAKIGRERAH